MTEVKAAAGRMGERHVSLEPSMPAETLIMVSAVGLMFIVCAFTLARVSNPRKG